MKRLPSYGLGIFFTLFFYCIIVSVPGIYDSAIKWADIIIACEKFLLIQHGLLVYRSAFPRFGVVLFSLSCVFTLIGMMVVARWVLAIAHKLFGLLPRYSLNKTVYLRSVSIIILALIIAGPVGYMEVQLRRPKKGPIELAALKFKSPAECPDQWYQETAADDQGSNYFLSVEKNGAKLHLNKQGFISPIDYSRSIVDSLHRSGKKVILVLGDSFVEGTTSTTWDHTFCALLQSELSGQYVILNTGVRGMDPLDYKLKAEKYISDLRPDMVVLCFCGHNDIMNYDRKPTPFIPLWYNTSQGHITSNICNKLIFPTQDSLYRYLMANAACNKEGSAVRRVVCRHSYICSFAYSFFISPMVPPDDPDTSKASYRNLLQIKQLCRQNEVPLLMAFIPSNELLKETEAGYKAAYKDVFMDMLPDIHFPLGFESEDYIKNDMHFNDKGNRKFADYLEQLIKAS